MRTILPLPTRRRWRASARAARSIHVGLAFALLLGMIAGPLRAQQAMTLQQAIQIAQQRGLSARAARSSLDAARWRDQAFGAQFLPQLSLQGNLPNLNRSIIPVPQANGVTVFAPQSQVQTSLGLRLSQEIPWTGTQLFVSSSLTRVDQSGQQQSRLWQSTPVLIGLQQSLFRPNTLKWDSREQTVKNVVAERQYLEAREDVAVNTATAFFDLYAARMSLQNVTANAAVNDTLYTLSQGRYQVGKIGENDLLQSQLALLRARNAVDGAKLEHERALAAFKLLLNLPADTDVTVLAPVDVPTITVDTALAVAEALRNQSEMENLTLQTLEARRQVNTAQLSNGFSATVSATAGYNQTAPLFGAAYQSLLDQQQLTLSVQMPLIQWGAHHAEVEAARADQERVASTVTATRRAAMQDVHFAAMQLMQSQRQLALSAKADTVAAKRFEVAKDRYVIGKIGISDLYIAQNEKDAALLAYVQALRGYWTAYYRLRRLTLYDFATNRRIELVDAASTSTR
jgi:outer membrane protein TolC